jgi:dihydrolipoamide dehydrogenase
LSGVLGMKINVTRDDSSEHVEVVVIGGGPGGYTAAFRAADLGKKVLLVEQRSALGGVCLNVGCIPSKALLHTAKTIMDARELPGVRFGQPRVDLDTVRTEKDRVVERLTKGLASLARSRTVRVAQGTAAFTSPTSLRISNEREAKTIRFDHAVIAVGSSPVRIKGVPYGDPRVMESTEALALEEAPKRLLVVGGGIIGLELASVYHAFGSKITIAELSGQLVPPADADLVEPLMTRISRQYEAILLETELEAIEPGREGLSVRLKRKGHSSTGAYDKVLVAVGRRANGAALDPAQAGVRCEPSGVIAVDQAMRTNVPHIFAVGDVVGGPMLAHKASHEAKIAAEVIAGHKACHQARCIPSVAYTDPELAWVGVTEKEALAAGLAFEVSKFPWAASGRALTLGRTEGLTKLIYDKESRRLLGAGIAGHGAGELIAELALAIEMDADIGDLGLTVHPHPTLSETVAFAAERAEGSLVELHDRPRKACAT